MVVIFLGVCVLLVFVINGVVVIMMLLNSNIIGIYKLILMVIEVKLVGDKCFVMMVLINLRFVWENCVIRMGSININNFFNLKWWDVILFVVDIKIIYIYYVFGLNKFSVVKWEVY